MFVVDTGDWQSECHVFDAKDIEQGPIARIKIPQRIPTSSATGVTALIQYSRASHITPSSISLPNVSGRRSCSQSQS